MSTEHVRQPWIAPLERFVAPADIDGVRGDRRWRRKPKMIDADNDVAAVRAWLESLQRANDHTLDCYRNAAEKLLNWACFAKGKALSSIDDADVSEFAEFLVAPRPASDWICTYRLSRDDPGWRPFRRNLSQGTVQQTLCILGLMFSWLSSVGYADMPRIGARSDVRMGYVPRMITANFSFRHHAKPLSKTAWYWVVEYLVQHASDTTRLAVELAYFGNLRWTEIDHLRIADCIAPSGDCVTWRLHMDSMRNRTRCVFVLPPLSGSLSRWFAGLQCQPKVVLSTKEERAASPPLFGAGVSPYQRSRAALRVAAALAAAGGDATSSEELQTAGARCLRGALESHAGGDRAFILGFIANAENSRRPVSEYMRRIALANDDIVEGWARLAPFWRPYGERVELKVRANLLP